MMETAREYGIVYKSREPYEVLCTRWLSYGEILQTREAFANYKKALESQMPSYVKTELYRIFINDLNDGSRQAKSFAKKTDITVVLDNWLDKYGSIEEIKQIVQSVSSNV